MMGELNNSPEIDTSCTPSIRRPQFTALPWIFLTPLIECPPHTWSHYGYEVTWGVQRGETVSRGRFTKITPQTNSGHSSVKGVAYNGAVQESCHEWVLVWAFWKQMQVVHTFCLVHGYVCIKMRKNKPEVHFPNFLWKVTFLALFSMKIWLVVYTESENVLIF